jgi:hypothetical protein
MRTTKQMTLIVTAAVLACACGSSGSETTTSTSATAATTATTATTAAADARTPFHAVPTEPVLISGSATCSFSSGLLSATCQLDLSDPRVTGTETHDWILFYPGGEVGDVWFATDARITNDDGSWTGSVQAADDGLPIGEAHYVGNGAYEGLEFHYYFFQLDLDSPAKVLGWISDGA